MREPYITEDGRIHHSWGNLATFGYSGYLNIEELSGKLDDHERILLSIWCWDLNMMYVEIENPSYEPLADHRFGNMPMMRGKSILPTEMRDYLSETLQTMGLINEYGVPFIQGSRAGTGFVAHAKELE